PSMMNVRRAKKGWFKMSKRRNHSPQFKAKLAVEALKEERSVSEIAADYQLNPNLVRRWRDELAEKASVIFSSTKQIKEQKRREQVLEAERDELLKAVGVATVERDWLRRIYKTINGGEEPPGLGQV
ncbi:MAG: transposase, partial [Actinomycetes bacterium]|nr:transposase [Actinomycetes bacterium]